jgi:hypothetical protein
VALLCGFRRLLINDIFLLFFFLFSFFFLLLLFRFYELYRLSLPHPDAFSILMQECANRGQWENCATLLINHRKSVLYGTVIGGQNMWPAAQPPQYPSAAYTIPSSATFTQQLYSSSSSSSSSSSQLLAASVPANVEIGDYYALELHRRCLSADPMASPLPIKAYDSMLSIIFAYTMPGKDKVHGVMIRRLYELSTISPYIFESNR